MGKLIELDEALKIGLQFINQYETFRVAEFTRKINSLPQIDIEETIKEMIDSGKGWNSDNSWNYLEELLQKFKS